jgi:hypothetical protein
LRASHGSKGRAFSDNVLVVARRPRVAGTRSQ